MKTNNQIKEIKKVLELTPCSTEKDKKEAVAISVQVDTLSKYLNEDKKAVVKSLKQYIDFYHTELKYPTFNANSKISINALIEIIKEIEDQELYQELQEIKNNTMEVQA